MRIEGGIAHQVYTCRTYEREIQSFTQLNEDATIT